MSRAQRRVEDSKRRSALRLRATRERRLATLLANAQAAAAARDFATTATLLEKAAFFVERLRESGNAAPGSG
jgi:hypothetical protein